MVYAKTDQVNSLDYGLPLPLSPWTHCHWSHNETKNKNWRLNQLGLAPRNLMHIIRGVLQ